MSRYLFNDEQLFSNIIVSTNSTVLTICAAHRDLPMTMKSAFYPILGDKIFGWMGDLLDIVSVATTLFGVCTSLGLGVKQLNTGFSRLNSKIDESFQNQVR